MSTIQEDTSLFPIASAFWRSPSFQMGMNKVGICGEYDSKGLWFVVRS